MSTKRLLHPEIRSKDEENIYSLLRRFIVGHEETIRKIAKKLSILRILGGQMRTPGRPADRAVFLGCTGSGKTYIAEVISRILFGFDGLIKVVGGDFGLEHQITKLTGASHGYIGFDVRPLFTQEILDLSGYLASTKAEPIVKLYSRLVKNIDYAFQRRNTLENGLNDANLISAINSPIVRQGYQQARGELEKINANLSKWIDKRDKIEAMRPDVTSIELPAYDPEIGYPSILLVDELEKSHQALHRLMLEWLDKAQFTITGQYGETISFRNTLIYMTSNIGQEEMLKITGEKPRFFEVPRSNEKGALEREYEEKRQEIYSTTLKEFLKVVSPEFAGRVGYKNIFSFSHPSRNEQAELLEDIMLTQYNNELKQIFPVTVSMTKEARNYILNSARKEDTIIFGIRSLRDIFEAEVKEEITALMARPEEEGGIIYGDKIRIDVDPESQSKLRFFLTSRSKKKYIKEKMDIEEIRQRQELMNESGGLCEFVFEYDKAA